MKCPHCGEEYSDDLRSEFCPSCGGRFDEEPAFPAGEPGPEEEGLFPGEPGAGGEALYPEDEETPLFTSEPSEPDIVEEYYCPWEDRERLGFLKAWWETTKKALFSPTDFYRRLAPTGRMGDAVLFAVTWFVINGVIAAIYGLIFQGAQFGLMGLLGQSEFGGANFPLEMLGVGGMMGVSALVNLVCTPVMGLFWMVILAGIYHLVLMALKGTSQPFEATLRVVCYASCYILWVLIPICGSFVGWIYSIILAIVGLSEVHKSGGGKAAAAVLLPIALCLTCLIGGVVLAISLGAFANM